VGCLAAFIGNDVPRSNGGFGFYDRGLENVWISASVEGSTGRPYVMPGARQQVLVCPYEESDQASYLRDTIMIGGISAVSPLSGSPLILQNRLSFGNFIVVNAQGADVFETAIGGPDGGQPSSVLSWKWHKADNSESEDWTMAWDNVDDDQLATPDHSNYRVWRIAKASTFVTSGSIQPAAYFTAYTSPKVRQDAGGGLAGFPSFLLGKYFEPLHHEIGSDPIRISVGDDNNSPVPPTGKQGDIVFNPKPQAGQYIGWVCVGIDSQTQNPIWKRFGAIES
jgi:hypothetical protein